MYASSGASVLVLTTLALELCRKNLASGPAVPILFGPSTGLLAPLPSGRSTAAKAHFIDGVWDCQFICKISRGSMCEREMHQDDYGRAISLCGNLANPLRTVERQAGKP